MPKISNEGERIIKAKIQTPLETAAEILLSKNNFKDVQPMFELVMETLRQIKTWEKVD